MSNVIKVAVIGLDTSHAVAMPKLIQDPSTPTEFRVEGLHISSCLRFETPFANREILDTRQEYLESIGVKVTEDFDEAVADCDALMLNINDSSLHLQYFSRCAALGKRIFLDKPFADTLKHAREIDCIARINNTEYFTASSLRFAADVCAAASDEFSAAHVWGPVGTAAAGSSIVWYGVHTFEMLQKFLGCGACGVFTVPDANGWQCVVSYPDDRRGIVELTRNRKVYGGMLRNRDGKEKLFEESCIKPLYYMLLKEVENFFRTGIVPVEISDSLEIMALLEAAEHSAVSGKFCPLN